MENKTPLRLKLKIGRSSTPEPPLSPANKMTEEEDQFGSDEEYDEEGQDNGQGDDLEVESYEDNQSRNQNVSQEDNGRERHKKSKKKKKKREKERHKHKHHKDRSEAAEDEPPSKKFHIEEESEDNSQQIQSTFKELLEILVVPLQKRDAQSFFAFPVSDLIAPGYSSIISEPMEFSTIQKKIKEGSYTKLSQFEYDVRLICNNCMIYNQPNTIYYKAAKKLLQSSEKICSAERIVPLKKEYENLTCLPKDILGFDIHMEMPDIEEGSQDSSMLSDNENSQDVPSSKFEAIPDNMSAEKILEQAQIAADEAAEKLTKKKPVSMLGFLRQKGDGTTSLNFLTGCEGNVTNQKEKQITLGKLTGKLTQGASALHNYRDDKRSMAKPVKPLNYGNFSSFCPSYDSTFANLNKEESDMVFATYGNETAVQYAESICDFSRDCDMAMHLVDQLLNLLTHQQHSRTKAIIEDRKRMQQEDMKIHSLLFNSTGDESTTSDSSDFTPNFTSLRTLKDIGIDTSFLSTLEKVEEREKIVSKKLNSNAVLLNNLAKEQKDRLSKPLPINLNKLLPPSQNELKLAEKVSEGLMSVAREVPPGALAPVPIVRRAMGITMMPVASESSDQVNVE